MVLLSLGTAMQKAQNMQKPQGQGLCVPPFACSPTDSGRVGQGRFPRL